MQTLEAIVNFETTPVGRISTVVHEDQIGLRPQSN